MACARRGVDVCLTRRGKQMNSVSWFIYFAQVFGSLSTVFAISGVLLTIAVLLRFAFARFANAVNMADGPHDTDYRHPQPIHRGYAGLAFGLMVLASFIPERNTMYAIAA